MAGDGTITLTPVPTRPAPTGLAEGHPRRPAGQPRPRGGDRQLAPGHPHRSRPAVRADGPAAPPLPHTLRLLHERPDHLQQASDRPTYTQRLQGRDDLGIACDFVKKVRGDDPTPAEHALAAPRRRSHPAHHTPGDRLKCACTASPCRPSAPSAGTHTIDFDSLSSDGLFLLHGATGAGKSTVFDAICYALYGKPPGDRDQLLRSDHAADHLLTQVVLEATISGRRLRSPAYPSSSGPRPAAAAPPSRTPRLCCASTSTTPPPAKAVGRPPARPTRRSATTSRRCSA